MSRIVSVWLPHWPIRRFLAAQAIGISNKRTDKPVDPDRPFVLTVAGTGGLRIAALNEVAQAAGLAVGEPLADARAKAEFLQVRAADPAADDEALRRLALWATRYTPTASPWDADNGADGFFLDVEGASHLFGGEEKLIVDLANRLEGFGLPARITVADTAGAAWAASHFHAARLCVLPSGEETAVLESMPVAALRLKAETRSALRRLGFKTVGALIGKPRAPFAARFAAALLRRLDQALGRIDEPLVPIVAPPVYHSLNYLLEPIVTAEAIVARASRLMGTLAHVLTRDDVGARRLRLCLYRVDGLVETLDLGLTAPTRSAVHVARLIELKLEALTTMEDAGFGFEAIGLAVLHAEPMPARQTEFVTSEDDAATERTAALVDALRQRLGPNRVRYFAPIASHLPERAETMTDVGAATQFPPPERGRVRVGVSDAQDDPSLDCLRQSIPPLSGEGNWMATQQPRPLLLLPQAEPAKVTALVPDGPPRRFSWRGVTHEVAGAEGPERIAAEWWRQSVAPSCDSDHAPTRDYYLVEDSAGGRFWLFREGLYGRETTDAQWFVQGLFA